MADFIREGLEFFRAVNNFFSAIGAFLSDPLKYIFAVGYWASLFIAVISLFLKTCGFKSGKWFTGGTVASIIFKIATMMKC